MAVIFDLNKIFQFCFDIRKGNRNILNINSVFFMNNYKELTQTGAKITHLSGYQKGPHLYSY